MKHLKYLRYVLRHKWFVFVECLKLGVPLWIAVFHDWDKFLPDEWFPYVGYFHGTYLYKNVSDIPGGLKSLGIYPKTKADADREFADAWNAHQKRNKHHWQYWLITWDRGDTECLPMPDVYAREMLADWRGAGIALGKPDTAAWYAQNKDKMKLHPDTRAWIESQL
jgi:hypothetical protein